MPDKNIEELKTELIPLWKWILLFFCPVHIGYDEEGDVACVTFVKILFKQMYVMRTDYFCISTGNLLRTRKLTRKG